PATGDPYPLGEVETGCDRSELLVYPTQPAEEVAADEHRNRRDEGDVTDDVVLLEVDLALVETGIRLTEHVGGRPDAFECVERPPNQELRAGEGGLETVCLRHQGLEGVGSGPGISVENPHILDGGV